MEPFKKLLKESKIIEKVTTQKDLVNLRSIKDSVNPISIMMGQTFDGGQPYDLIKYALIMMELEDICEENGQLHLSNWLLADHFMTYINKEKELSECITQREARQNFLERINKTYKGNIKIIYSSDLINQENYIRILNQLEKKLEEIPSFKKALSNSIPLDRRKNNNSLRYPLEELATIFSLNTNIKIGPKYETNYDSPARKFAEKFNFKKYVAIHLTPTFPLGNPSIPKEDNKEIELFGLTPYKFNSKKLGQYRLDPINGNLSKDKDLILDTIDVRPIYDLIYTSLMAKKRLIPKNKVGAIDLSLYSHLDFSELKEMAYTFYKDYIKDPLTHER